MYCFEEEIWFSIYNIALHSGCAVPRTYFRTRYYHHQSTEWIGFSSYGRVNESTNDEPIRVQ